MYMYICIHLAYKVSLASVRSCGDNISIGEEWYPAFGVVYSDFVLGEGGTVCTTVCVSPKHLFDCFRRLFFL